ncbi:hypothetical protein [Amycolatopsis sp. NPDC021455]|uniref:hypothetical protein n=1 Tax=Amycolatopsis sp. NPDC021455 TaxID=3154901 RepID=UPI0033D6AD81
MTVAVVTAVVIAARVVFLFTVPYLVRLLDRRPDSGPAGSMPGPGWSARSPASAVRSRWPPRWPCPSSSPPASRSRTGT